MTNRVLVTGAGGFIGHHLTDFLKEKGYWVRAVDIKHPDFSPSKADEFMLLDLREYNNCIRATTGINTVYNLAADMGGIGYITKKFAEIARNNVLINSHMLQSSVINQVSKYFYSSSACVYPSFLQEKAKDVSLRESDAHPSAPEEGYGWEKLYSEKLCEYFLLDYGLEIRVARFHNVYGELGTYEGGKEKAPAALCRKIALANSGDTIDIWGDGEQTRSFLYIADCIEGIFNITQSDVRTPLNLGSDHLVTINDLVETICDVANKKISTRHDLTKPQGVRGRNSNNEMIQSTLGWSPSWDLHQGIKRTYDWIKCRVELTR